MDLGDSRAREFSVSLESKVRQWELDDPVSFPAVNGIFNVHISLCSLVWFVCVKKSKKQASSSIFFLCIPCFM